MKYIIENVDIKENFLKNLLSLRGINDVERYLAPVKEMEEDASKLINIKEGFILYDKIIKNSDSKIKLIVDSDQDGYTSAAIIYLYTKKINPSIEITYTIHDGKQHGLEDMADLLEEKIDLLIIPDASSNDYELHRQFKEANIPILVLDHHEAEFLSKDAIVINNQFGNYPNKNLSGAGVVYKFCEYCDSQYGFNYAEDFIDLAAVGIIGDVMKITSLENRYIIYTGLRNIKNIFLKALIEKQAYSIKDTNHLTPTHIAFYITPLVNAMIRVGKAEEKIIMFEAFINGNEQIESTKRGAKGEIETISEQAARNCVNARARQNRLKEKAIETLDYQIQKNSLDSNKIIICQTEEDEIDSTLTGLIAMNLCSKYSKPVIVGKLNQEGFLRGSARGDNNNEVGNNLKDFFTESGYFEYAEGHQAAHGISIKQENIDNFLNYANNKLKDFNFSEGTYKIDFLRHQDDKDISDIIFEMAAAAELWGQDNAEPLILIKDIILKGNQLTLLKCKQNNIQFTYNNIEYITFNTEKLIEDLHYIGIDFTEKYKTSAKSESWRSTNEKEIRLTIVGTAAINSWMGKDTAQLTIKDYNLADPFFDF